MTTITASEKAFEFINTSLTNGLTVYISTMLNTIVVKPATIKKWEKAGLSLFKFDNEGNLRIGSGKNYNIICSKSTCLVKITAQ